MMKKINIALVAMLLVFQTILMPLGTYGVTFANEVANENIVKDVKINQCSNNDCTKKVDISDPNYRVVKNESVEIEYVLDVTGKKDGYTYMLDLPSVFKLTTDPYIDNKGDIMVNANNDSFKIGNYEFVGTNKVKFTFTNITGKGVSDITFGAWAEFIEAELTSPVAKKETVNIATSSGSKVIEYWTSPAGGDVGKAAKPNKLMNADTVTWTIDVNKGLHKLTNATLTDVMTSNPANNFNVVVGSLKANYITWNANGQVEVGELVTLSGTTFPLNLGDVLKDGQALRIQYDTKLKQNVETVFSNTATLSGKLGSENVSFSDDANIKLLYGAHVTKEGSNIDDATIAWEVLYNFDGKTIDTDASTCTGNSSCGVISDTLDVTFSDANATQATHSYDRDSVKLYRVDANNNQTLLTKGTDYTVSFGIDGKNNMYVELLGTQNNSQDGYKLSYNTKTTGDIYASFKVENTISADATSITKGKDILQQFFTKTHVINYATREIEWKITANGYDMKDAVLTDTPTDLKIDPSSVVVNVVKNGVATPVTGEGFLPSTQSGDLNSLNLDFSKSNTSSWSGNDKLEVTYITKLPEADQQKSSYNNVAGLKWKNSENEWVIAETIGQTANLIPHAQNNGYKVGTYNYTGDNYRTIDWEVGYNFNRDSGVTGQITDVWDSNQQFVLGTKLIIYPVTINKGGTWTKDTANKVEVNPASLGATANGFTANLATLLGNKWSAGSPYIITYSTSFPNNVIPKQANNKLSYSGANSKSYVLTAEPIDIKHGETYINKVADTAKPRYIAWDVFVNESQSFIEAGSVLKDTPSDNQRLEVEKDGSGNVTGGLTITQLQASTSGDLTKSSTTLALGTDYTAKVTNGSLAVTFKNALNHAYVIEYETYIAKLSGDFTNAVTYNGVTQHSGATTTFEGGGKVEISAGASGAWATANIKNPFNLTLKVKKEASGNNGYYTDDDRKSKTVLAGAVFELYLGTEKIGTATTDADGIATFTGLAVDEYTIKEVTAPSGYKIKTASYTLKANDLTLADTDGKIIGFQTTIENDKINQDVIFDAKCKNPAEYTVTYTNNGTKTFTIQQAADGAFTLTGNVPKVKIVDGFATFDDSGTAVNVDTYNNHIRIKDLPAGTYAIKQTKVSGGCLVSTTELKPTVPGASTTNPTTIPTDPGTFSNTPNTLVVTNVDKDDSDTPISDSTFVLYKVNGSCPLTGSAPVVITDFSDYEEVGAYTTDEFGEFDINFTDSDLGNGTYILVQESVNKYYLNKQGEVVTLGANLCIEVKDDATTEVPNRTFENERVETGLADLMLVKTVSGVNPPVNPSPLEGTIIQLKGTKFGSKSKTYTGRVGTGGKITEWYEGAEYPTTLTNPITKPLPDIYELTELTYVDGYTKLEGIADAANQSKVNNKVRFDYYHGSTDTEINVSNQKIERTIRVRNFCGKDATTYQLVDGSGTPILTDLSGNSIGENGIITVQSHTSGYTIIGTYHLAPGEYQLKQLTASAGCLLADKTEDWEIKDPNQDTEPDSSATWTTTETDTKHTVTVTNIEQGTTTPIQGSTFAIYKVAACLTPNENGVVDLTGATLIKDNLTTGTNGQVTFDFSTITTGAGMYIIVQDNAYKYYVNKQHVPVGECIAITTTDVSSIPGRTFENSRNESAAANLKLVKTDADYQAAVGENPASFYEQFIKDAVIRITGKEKGNIYEGTTGANGQITEWYLVKNDGRDTTASVVVHDLYTVTEPQFPANYGTLAVKAGAETTKLVTGQIEFDFYQANTAADKETIQITNKRQLNTVVINNSCGKEVSTYELHYYNGSQYVKVTEDANGEALSNYSSSINTNGVITLGAGQASVTLADLHLPKGQYKVVQLTGSTDDCIVVDKNPLTDNTPDFTVDSTPKTHTIDETDTPIYEAQLTFENCAKDKMAGTYTLTDAAGKTFEVVADINGQVKTKVPVGTYKVTGNDMVEREIVVTANVEDNLFTLSTENCGEVAVEFDRCDKLQAQGIAIYKADANGNVLKDAAGEELAPVHTAKPEFVNGQAVTITVSALPVGHYVAVALDKDEDANFDVKQAFEIKSGVSVSVKLVEECTAVSVPVTFDHCAKLAVMDVEVYKETATGVVVQETITFGETEVDGKTVKTIDLTEGTYYVVPKGTAEADVKKGKKVEIDETTKTISTQNLVQDCSPTTVTIEFDRCDKNGVTAVDIYQGSTKVDTVTLTEDGAIWTGDVTALPEGTYAVKVKDSNEVLTTFKLAESALIDAAGNSKSIKDDKVNLTFKQDCATVSVPVTFDNCAKLGTTAVDVYQVSTKDSSTIVFKETVTFDATEVDGKTAKTIDLAEGTYYFVPAGTPQTAVVSNGQKVVIDETTETVNVINTVQNCDPLPANIKLTSCDKLGATVVDLYKVDSDKQLILQSKQTITVTGGMATANLEIGSYVVVPVGTTAFDTDDIFTITNKTTDPIEVSVKENCNGVTITFKTCDQPFANTEFMFVDQKGNTFTLTTDEDGKATTTIPPGIYTVKNTATNTTRVVDVTAAIEDLFVVECDACTAAVTVPELANEILTISDGKLIETVTAEADGKFNVPFANGNLTVKDAAGRLVGTITVTDCKGEFVYPSCENPEVLLPEAVEQNVFLVSETQLGGKIASPDSAVLSFTVVEMSTTDTEFIYTSGDVTTILTSEDSVKVDVDGKLAIDLTEFEAELEYYIVNKLGEVLKVIRVENGDLVVYTVTLEEELRLTDCVQKAPIPFEPTPGVVDPTEPTEPIDPSNPSKPKLDVTANPDTIIGDGKTTSTFTAILTDEDGKPISNVDVVFETPTAGGTFTDSSGNKVPTITVKTDGNGEAKVTYTAPLIESSEETSKTITAKVKDEERGLEAIDEIVITFLPATVEGVITEGKDHTPAAGVEITVSLDKNDDGKIEPGVDFIVTVTTDENGYYKVPVPTPNATYTVEVTKKITVGDKEVAVTYKQPGKTGAITGHGKESFKSEKTVTGIVLVKDLEGKPAFLPANVVPNVVVRIKDSKGEYILDENGKPKEFPVNEQGVYSATGLTEGDYKIETLVKVPGQDKYLAFKETEVSITEDGEMNITSELVDPYGTITDSVTGKEIKDVVVTLYYADTERNKNKGITPHDKVYLPEVLNFPPFDNLSPVQITRKEGFYAWMVYPEADYYVTFEHTDYHRHTSPTISVEWDIVKYDTCLKPNSLPANSDETEKVKCGDSVPTPGGSGGGGGGGSIPVVPEPKPEQPVTPPTSGGGGSSSGGSSTPVTPEPTPEVTPVEPTKPVTPLPKPTPEQPTVTPVVPEQPPVELEIPEVTPGKSEGTTNSSDEEETDESINTGGSKTNSGSSEDEELTDLAEGGNKTSKGTNTPKVTGTTDAKPKLPQTDGEEQTMMMLAGFLLVAASMYAFFMRRRKQM